MRRRQLLNVTYNIFGEQSEPHTYRTAEKNLRHIYIYIYIYVFIYIYIYIYIYVRTSCTCRSRARYAQTSDRPVEVQRSI